MEHDGSEGSASFDDSVSNFSGLLPADAPPRGNSEYGEQGGEEGEYEHGNGKGD